MLFAVLTWVGVFVMRTLDSQLYAAVGCLCCYRCYVYVPQALRATAGHHGQSSTAHTSLGWCESLLVCRPP